MKLHLPLLARCIELPSTDPHQVRVLLDELGLEVKNVELEPHPVFTLETLANRPDHASAMGVAREISAHTLATLHTIDLGEQLPTKKASVQLQVATAKCSRYALVEAVLPKDLALRHEVAEIVRVDHEDVSARHPLVHALNYAQMELGQPMHAFDRAKVEGAIVVRELTEPLAVVALDGNEYQVPSGSIVICDSKKILAVAGVIGCANSMVTQETTAVLIESAIFDPVSVRKTAKAMRCATEASFIFERGADPEKVLPAVRRALLLATQPGKEIDAQGCTVVEGAATERRAVTISLTRIRRELGHPKLTEAEISARLNRLGYKVDFTAATKEFACVVPSWRLYDVSTADDIVEDIARSIGYNNTKRSIPEVPLFVAPRSPFEELRAAIDPVLVAHGFHEVITKAYYSPEVRDLLGRLDARVVPNHVLVVNALESANGAMRCTGVPHMVQHMESLMRRGLAGVKLFEFGRYFAIDSGDGVEGMQHERDVLWLACTGRWNHAEWRSPEGKAQVIQHLRGVLDSVVGALAQQLEVTASTKHPFLHPGIQGTLKVHNHLVGHFGQIHPRIVRGLDAKREMFFAELDVAQLIKLHRNLERCEPSVFQPVRRDFTVQVPVREFASRVVAAVTGTKVPVLHQVVVVDDFKKPEEDFRRLSLRVTLQSLETTLQAGEIDAAVGQITAALAAKGYPLVGS